MLAHRVRVSGDGGGRALEELALVVVVTVVGMWVPVLTGSVAGPAASGPLAFAEPASSDAPTPAKSAVVATQAVANCR